MRCLATGIEDYRAKLNGRPPAGRRLLRGQLQLPEQDVPREDARRLLRNDSARAFCAVPASLRRGPTPRTHPTVSRSGRRRRFAGRGARGADGARRAARERLCRCPSRGSLRGFLTSARRSTGRRPIEPGGSAARARHPEVPLATSSTSSAIAQSGAARRATSASTWSHRAVALSGATGARSRSGATLPQRRPTTSRPKCCASSAIRARPCLVCRRHLRLPRGLGRRTSRQCAQRGRRRALHDPVARGPGEPEHGCLAPHAGCREVWLGAESGSQGFSTPWTRDARHRDRAGASALGAEGSASVSSCSSAIRARSSTTFSPPGARERTPPTTSASASLSVAGHEFQQQVKRELGDKRNWQESKDLDMMFFGTYRSEFYRIWRGEPAPRSALRRVTRRLSGAGGMSL